ncbi:hypothetical protein RDABS01_033556 [Bienertia sinuspersici]
MELVLDRVSRASSAAAADVSAVHKSKLNSRNFDKELAALYPEGVLDLLKEICNGQVTPWGTLSDGRVVAVKQLSVSSKQGKSQFITEIATISAVQHRNLVKLYGCCLDGKNRLLVYEYLQNKSLDKVLFGDSNLELNWAQRFEVCLGVARGLTYLHQESRLRIVHRDVKSSNILLDSDLNPKISDFGLAKLYDDKKTHMSTGVAGTV